MAFRQFMRPLRPQSQIPPFRLVYFDPDDELYVTRLSNAIPLTVIPSTGPAMIGSSAPPEMPIPVEQMTDILGITKGATGLLQNSGKLPSWVWQLIPAGLLLILVIAILRRHLAPRLRKDPDELARLRDLRTLDRAPSEMKGFYRETGHFIERWLGGSDDPLTKELLAKRDQNCFREDVTDETIPRSERQRILRQLRKLALPVVTFFLLLGSGNLRAEESADGADSADLAYEESRYSDAARLWLESGPFEQLSADTLYNIGNAAYRLGSPGEAALYWRRALNRDDTHAEARQNLRFFERKFGSIVIKRPDYQHVLARLSLDTWKNMVWGALWVIGIAALIFPATHPGARLRVAAIGALVAAPLIAASGACGWYYYPDDARFAPPSEQAVIVSDKASIRTDASRNAPLVIEAPAGSLCRLLSRSGNWVYLAFSNDTRGWVPAGDVEKIIPDSQPSVPEARKSDDEGKSA